MSQLRISPRATEDLVEIWSYIADDSEAHADAFIDKIREAMKLLARQPRLWLRVFRAFPLAGMSFSIELPSLRLKSSVYFTAHAISKIFSRVKPCGLFFFPLQNATLQHMSFWGNEKNADSDLTM